ncbi:hypothetical protein [Sorangium sp. So ce381]|uniref:hypothetical protein n=1 Tax=Sorangium sp. So ce381 TaxID=3133307 RepID=UPI003F5C2205
MDAIRRVEIIRMIVFLSGLSSVVGGERALLAVLRRDGGPCSPPVRRCTVRPGR